MHLTHDFQYQVMVSITLAYGSFYLAEYLHMSGVLACVSAGIVFSWKLNRSGKESELRKSLDGFWGVIEPTILSIIFLLIGIEATEHLALNYWKLTFLIFGLTLFVRFVVLVSILKLFPYWRTRYISNEISLITLAGIKGTMSIVLILSLKANYDSNNELLISLSFGAVVLSLVIQNLLIYPLTNLVQKRK
jgi:CPA1 family monovalent cation:H+ antiporter